MQCYPRLLSLLFWLTVFADGNGDVFSTKEYNQASYNTKRRMHSTSLLKLRKMQDMSKSYQMLLEMIQKVVSVLAESRPLVESVNMHTRPISDEVGNAFALIFENTALLMDMVSMFPELAHSHLDNANSVLDQIKWAIALTRSSGLLSEVEVETFSLAEQELNLVPRPDNFDNPFSQANLFRRSREADEKRLDAEKKARRKRSRGPRLTTPRQDL